MTEDIAALRRVALVLVNGMRERNGQNGALRGHPFFKPLNECVAALSKCASNLDETDARCREARTAVIAISDAAFGLRTRSV